jgi:hypothetical protein
MSILKLLYKLLIDYSAKRVEYKGIIIIVNKSIKFF